jgi:hypothetical protein
MAQNAGSYRSEKRKKEVARQKKQEQKRQERLEKKQGKNDPAISPDGTPLLPPPEILPDADEDDVIDPVL